jgi:hypothetical protein
MGPQVPSLTHVGKSRRGGKVPTFGLQETIKIWLISIEVDLDYIFAEVFVGFVLRVGSSFFFQPSS